MINPDPSITFSLDIFGFDKSLPFVYILHNIGIESFTKHYGFVYKR